MHAVSVIALGVLMLHPPCEAHGGPCSARRNGSYRSPTLRAFFEATTRLPRPSGRAPDDWGCPLHSGHGGTVLNAAVRSAVKATHTCETWHCAHS